LVLGVAAVIAGAGSVAQFAFSKDACMIGVGLKYHFFSINSENYLDFGFVLTFFTHHENGKQRRRLHLRVCRLNGTNRRLAAPAFLI
jgi:hypothetical protein